MSPCLCGLNGFQNAAQRKQYMTQEHAEIQCLNEISSGIIGCSIEVHKEVGPGLLESVYEECLCYELKQKGFLCERQKELPVIYKKLELNAGFRIDILIENSVIIELKAIERILPIHKAQILSYMKLMNIKLGLLINFNVPVLKDGINRFVL